MGLIFQGTTESSIVCEAIPKEVNHLIDEAQTMGISGPKCHGANAIVSFLGHFFCWFGEFGEGENTCVLHADNCGRMNKNRTVIAYCVWCVICGHHNGTTLSFMVAG